MPSFIADARQTDRRARRYAGLATTAAAMVAWLAMAASVPTLAADNDGDARAVGLADTFVGRVEATASVASLESAILSGSSATAVLERWCGEHKLGAPARLRAVRDPAAAKPADAQVRHLLEVGPDETVRYRHVALTCGDRILSDADNWYVPGRLTPAMNATLDGTDQPFGKVIAPLGPTRTVIAVADRWTPLPPGWEGHLPGGAEPDAAAALLVPPVLFAVHALVVDKDRRPLSVVVERYGRANLAFARQP